MEHGCGDLEEIDVLTVMHVLGCHMLVNGSMKVTFQSIIGLVEQELNLVDLITLAMVSPEKQSKTAHASCHCPLISGCILRHVFHNRVVQWPISPMHHLKGYSVQSPLNSPTLAAAWPTPKLEQRN